MAPKLELTERQLAHLQKQIVKLSNKFLKNINTYETVRNKEITSYLKTLHKVKQKLANSILATVSLPRRSKVIKFDQSEALATTKLYTPDLDLALKQRIESIKKKANVKTTLTKTGEKITVVLEPPTKKTIFSGLAFSLRKIAAHLSGKSVVIKNSSEQATLDRYRGFAKFDFRKVAETATAESNVEVVSYQKTGNIIRDTIGALNEWTVNVTKISTRDKVTFYQLLDTMINAGIPLIKSLHQLVKQTKNLHLRKIIASIAYQVENGTALSIALGSFPDVFDDAARGMIKAGEASGSMGDILRRISISMEKSEAISSKIKGALIYPITVVVILIIVSIIVLTWIVPALKDLFSGIGATELPKATQILIAMSNFLQAYLVYLFFAFIAFYVVFINWIKTSTGRFYWDYLKLKIPVVGPLLTKLCLSRFTRSLSTLQSANISIIKALEINADSIGNEIYRREVLLTAEAVKKGVSIADDLKNSKLFPSMLVNMIAVGEETAKLDHVAGKIADFYDEEIDNTVKNMSSLMEPIIIVVLGVAVAGLVSAVMQPIIDLSGLAETS